MNLSDENVKVAGITSKYIWLEIDLPVTQSSHAKTKTIKLSVEDLDDLKQMQRHSHWSTYFTSTGGYVSK